jgi:alkylation response protein AidB-like acyl-CoA dehydrogenase
MSANTLPSFDNRQQGGFLTEQHEMIRDTTRKLAERVLSPGAAERDRTGAHPAVEIRALSKNGLMGMLVPEEYGGAGMDFLGYCLAIEEIAAADAGISTMVHVHNLGACRTLARFGTPEQKRRYLPAMTRGEVIGAFLLTEPQAGSDTAAIRTTARRAGAYFVLNGTKQFITNGKTAGIGLVTAVTDPAAGRHGITIFAVLTDMPGYKVLRVEEKMGQRSSDTAQIAIEDCRVPAENIVGREGGGYAVVMGSLADGRITVAAQAVGIARAAYEQALRYAGEREAYGAPISRLQAVAFRLADMATQIDVARQYYQYAAALCAIGRPCAKEAAMAKLFATEMAERICSDALQIHGGYGYLRDFPLERYCRDVRVTKIYEGTSDIQRVIISREIMKR